MKRWFILCLIVPLLGGCSTANKRDPLEPFNRAMFSFNDTIDKAVLKPVATGYTKVTPSPIRQGVSNFFSNIGDVWVAVNNLLQGKVGNAASDVGRVAVNSTAGLLGLFDVASPMGLERHNEDFGQTLGRWGVGSGAYIVLPLIGPSSIRDGVGFAVDSWADPIYRIERVATRNTVAAVRIVSKRADLLDVGQIVEDASLDRYTFMRDAFTQRRLSLVYDGEPPKPKIEDLPDEDLDAIPGGTKTPESGKKP